LLRVVRWLVSTYKRPMRTVATIFLLALTAPLCLWHFVLKTEPYPATFFDFDIAAKARPVSQVSTPVMTLISQPAPLAALDHDNSSPLSLMNCIQENSCRVSAQVLNTLKSQNIGFCTPTFFSISFASTAIRIRNSELGRVLISQA
jgi:hypothetical protein